MIQLSFPEARVLGCLIEKELTTPDYYPLTLNSLAAACNQSTNRDPVVAFDDAAVQNAVDLLRQKKLATVIFGAGSRVQKYRHDLPEHYTLERHELALLAVLLLRGPQTPGELRQRSERMAGRLLSPNEVEEALEAMGKGNDPLVRVIPAGAGRKEKRYVHLLSGEPDESMLASTPAPVVYVPSPQEEETTRLKEEVAALREELRQLQEEFAAFRKQFE